MTSKERVLKAFKHEIPDRTPIFEKLIKTPVSDFILNRPCAATNFTYRMKLMESGDWRTLVDQEAQDIIELAKILKLDMVRLGINIPKEFERPKKIGENLWQTGETLTQYFPVWGGAKTIDPEQDKKSTQEKSQEMEKAILEEYQPPNWSEDEFYVFRKAKEIIQKENLNLAIFSSVYTIGAATLPSYMHEWFYTRPELMHRFYEKNALYGIELGKKYIQLGADIIGIGGDFAGKTGPMVSPKIYREFMVPYLRQQAEAFRQSGVFVTNASDGNLWPVIDDFLVGTAVDGYEEIDVRWGMDLGLLKQRFGDHFCFIGNVDCAWTLVYGTPEQVKQETIQCIEKGLPTGHILMCSNSIHQGVKPENFLAMIETHRQYFGY